MTTTTQNHAVVASQAFLCLSSIHRSFDVQSFLKNLETLLVDTDPCVLLQALNSLYFAVLSKKLSTDYCRSLSSTILSHLDHSNLLISNLTCLILSHIIDYDLIVSIRTNLILAINSFPSLTDGLSHLLFTIGKISKTVLNTVSISDEALPLLCFSKLKQNPLCLDTVKLLSVSINNDAFDSISGELIKMIIDLFTRDRLTSSALIRYYLGLLWNCILTKSELVPLLYSKTFLLKILNLHTFSNKNSVFSLINIVIIVYSYIDTGFFDDTVTCAILTRLFELFQSVDVTIIGNSMNTWKDIGVLFNLLVKNLIDFNILNEIWFVEGIASCYQRLSEFNSHLLSNNNSKILNCDSNYRQMIITWFSVPLLFSKSNLASFFSNSPVLSFILNFLTSVEFFTDLESIVFSILSRYSRLSDEHFPFVLQSVCKLLQSNPIDSLEYVLVFLVNFSHNVVFIKEILRFNNGNEDPVLLNILNQQLSVAKSKTSRNLILNLFENLFYHVSYAEVNMDIISLLNTIIEVLSKQVNESTVSLILGVFINISYVNFDCLLPFLETGELFVDLLSQKNHDIVDKTLQLILISISNDDLCRQFSENIHLFNILKKHFTVNPLVVSKIVLTLSQEVAISSPSLSLRTSVVDCLETLLKIDNKEVRQRSLERIVDLST
ncbi:hypothetical protein GEMRC1_001658 [Eukaryota sp. GEM-RC1]